MPRLRLGIGQPPEGVPGDEYVLRKFKRGEQAPADEMAGRAADVVRAWLQHGDMKRLVDEANRNEGKG